MLRTVTASLVIALMAGAAQAAPDSTAAPGAKAVSRPRAGARAAAKRAGGVSSHPRSRSYTSGWLSSAMWCVRPMYMPYSASNGMRRVRLRPEALGSSTRQSPSIRATGCFGLSMIVAATKQCVAPSSSGTSLQAAARRTSGSRPRQSSSTSEP